MIDAKELRIGNVLLYLVKANEWITVSELREYDLRARDSYDTELGFLYTDEKSIAPIPLTSEILEVCGFVKGSKVLYNKGDLYIERDGSKWDCWLHDGDVYNFSIRPQKYLHQLQNLYYSLTGEELTVNIPQPINQQ